MPAFNVGGLATGVDFNDLINKMIEIKRQPIKILEDKKSVYNEKISSFSDISSKLSTLKSAADQLKTLSNFYAKQVSVDDKTVLDATVTGAASAGNYSVTVTSLASEEMEVKSTGESASTSVVNSSGGDRTFQYTYAGTQRSLTVADGTTLEGLRDLIIDDTGNPGVSAKIINDGSTYRLAITGNSPGASNTITVDAGTDLTGYGPADFSETKSAADSSFSVDSVSITRSTNSISDVITGVTFDLFKADPSTGRISVTSDKDKIKDQIKSFVTAYNDIAAYLEEKTDYDATTEVSGILSGESTARSIETNLKNIISGTFSTGPSDMNILAQIGITSNSETGQLETDESVLDTKLSGDIDDVATFFTDTTEGLAVELYDYIDDVSSTVDGAIQLRKDGLQDVIDDIDSKILNMEYRIEKSEKDLTRKFTNLETLVNDLQGQANMLSMMA